MIIVGFVLGYFAIGLITLYLVARRGDLEDPDDRTEAWMHTVFWPVTWIYAFLIGLGALLRSVGKAGNKVYVQAERQRANVAAAQRANRRADIAMWVDTFESAQTDIEKDIAKTALLELGVITDCRCCIPPTEGS